MFILGSMMLDAFYQSFLLVAISEMGDKTQLLSLILMLKFKQPWPILLGIFVATVLNHLGASWVGSTVAQTVPSHWLAYGLSILFVGFGLWILVPDSDEGLDQPTRHGAFLTTVVVFFFAEMGDKTQLATVALGAKFQNLWGVTMGSTLGMMLTNGLSVFGGERLIKIIPMKYIRFVASAMFIGFGIAIMPLWR